ncbi:hypothetical protein DYB38_011696 [Aphanomyces astaci]|uniref:Tc3 transposase DNA binding domain-containing protein n=1 Tax=Aphanomyces astaci TaxID=112090 RepID=A0A397CH13_APHAT|nr:hypothetical protein DYB38_011696 [Aphanomyces astaci]
MPAGSKLSEEEQGMILALKAVGKGLREIERLIGRSRGAITLFLKDTAAYNTKKRTGRPPKVTSTDIRRLIRTASNSFLSSRELVAQCQLTIKARRARQLLATCEHLKFVKAKATPKRLHAGGYCDMAEKLFPLGPRLTIEEQGAAWTFRLHNLSYRAISKHLGRSKDTERAYLIAPDSYGTSQKGQKATKIVDQE